MKIKNMGEVKSLIYQWKSNVISNKISKISDDELKNKLGNYAYLKTFINIKKNNECLEFNPTCLLSPLNFDVYAKYLYAKMKLLNIDNKFIYKLYISHIYAFNHYREPDGSKSSKKEFINSFNNLINKFEKMDLNNALIPISSQNIIIDGSHRLSLALLYNKNVSCVRFDIDDLVFDYNFFKQRKLKSKYLDYMALQIKDLLPDVGCLILKYSNNNEKNNIIKNLYDKFDIYYIKEIKIDLGKLNILLDDELYENTVSKVLFVILKGKNEEYNVINDLNKVDILCKTFLNENTLSFINKINNSDLIKAIDGIKNLNINKIYKNNTSLNNDILEFNPKDIYYIKNIAFIKEK